MDGLSRPKMYRLRPYFEIKKVKLPACMYLLKPVHQLTNIAPSTKDEKDQVFSISVLISCVGVAVGVSLGVAYFGDYFRVPARL